MDRHVVIVAGGKGSRMRSELPKQFLLLLEVPILMHTVERFVHAFEDINIIVVLPSDQVKAWENLCLQMDFDIPHKVVAGGETRYASVTNGLNSCEGSGVVAIHDGVRPLLSPGFIQKCMNHAEKNGSAIPVLPIKQSLRMVEESGSSAIDRKGIHTVQTPQCFHLDELKSCYAQDYNPTFTDDATVYEAAGKSVSLVEGEESNLKITTPIDIKIAQTILKKSKR
ncbi:MAG: 2-C-methyl-D-erythritol 4-phosphate cytidylyltransferase [Flavobacteriales bacterium]|nr:2-C-methyl-D-erythritol 4-phosphate cytidylyltransferase [Flavobacteriales bacterium]MBT3964292.1 2-C-methyl-D-erythritol 4-phosphate cytidylyltransferase [Flavobacteriales bacterium]MBT4705574.1 2-C-methyl-D-erythritol 4-phosphate cytidylyltransferase [Flavobacteriales bacterium]MBT4931113.1 2-C-methyl-D-erythritol 4-phosphate cytidylyltransferase [Flavobacteriales bacterium]MBT5133479.1 2-C-methyl-D-erythritol 4-phosphate cytidylyltransferase [Flavobacteriales bacterium]